MITVAVLFTNYGPYHIARLAAMHQLCVQLGWKAIAVEIARSEAAYPWRANIHDLPFEFCSIIQDQPLEQVSQERLIKAVWQTLTAINPDALAIAGYFQTGMLTALAWSRWHRKATVLLSASKEDDAPRQWWSEALKKLLLKGYQSALVGGQPQKRYLLKLGMAPDAISLGYNVVGNDAFHPDQIRGLANPANRPFFLSINRFVPKKNLLRLITAYALYRKQAEQQAWDLVLCGDGALLPQMKEQIAQYNLQDYIHLPGFLQQNELLPYFAHASCFVHASTQEQWGLVVNEAMAAGLPVLVSERCGCFEELVIDGVTGWGFDPENVEQIAALLLKMSSDPVNAKAMGNASLTHIQNFSPACFAQSLSHAVRYALHQQPSMN